MPRMTQQDVLKELQRVGAIIDDHVVLSSWRHSGKYINKDEAFDEPGVIESFCRELATRFEDLDVDFVVAPAVAGVCYAFDIVHYMFAMIHRAFADKDGAGGFIFKRGFERKLRGKRVLVLEDVSTTSATIRKVMDAVEAVGGIVVAVGMLWNRGGVTAEMLGTPRLECLVNIQFESWEANECPLCKAGVPVNISVGHGAEFVARQAAA